MSKSFNSQLLLFLLVINFAVYNCLAQNNPLANRQLEKAYGFYKIKEYNNALTEIEKILKKNPGFTDAILLQADVYKELRNPAMEIVSLGKALQYSSDPLILYRMGKANYSLANYEQALLNFSKYLDTNGIPAIRKTEVEHLAESCRFAVDAIKNPVGFNPIRLNNNINTTDDEYWPSVSLDGRKLVFTRLLKPVRGLTHEDFFVATLKDGDWCEVTPLAEVNTPENEGAQALSADGRLLFFTACNRPGGTGSCDIYYSLFDGKNWSKPRNAGNVLNSSSWDAQPTVTSDNRYLYFSSNRPGGKGKKDIWRAEILAIGENGTIQWGQPQNAGNTINTAGDEISPFIHPNNRSFYFASDFHTGLGGMDLFMSEIQEDGTFSTPVNLGFPINTNKDEQGLNISFDGKTAYFASERKPGFGLDIYSFELPVDIRPEPVSYVKAKITDAETGEIVHATVDLINLSIRAENRRNAKTDENGEIMLCLPLNANYAFNVLADGYLFYSKSFQFTGIKTPESPETLEIRLNRIQTGAQMNLYNIYFETDSFRILPASEPELEKLAFFMKNNPHREVEIQGHTDNTGRTEKNLLLSELRAKSVFEYLVANGIAPTRMNFKGLGESFPVATNETEEGKRLNRRTTIKIVK